MFKFTNKEKIKKYIFWGREPRQGVKILQVSFVPTFRVLLMARQNQSCLPEKALSNFAAVKSSRIERENICIVKTTNVMHIYSVC
jgi:hypothetical protein